MRIKHNDLTHWFIRDHDQLPEAYLRSCRKFFKELSNKQQASSNKPQATSVKLSHCGSRVHVLKIDLTERYNYEYKRSFKNCGRPEQAV